MATAIEQFFADARKTGKNLNTKQQQKLKQIIGAKGKVGEKELQKGQKTYKASGKDFGDYLSAVAGTVKTSKLSKDVRKKLEGKGYVAESGYYTKKAPISESMISAAQGQGFADEDIRKSLAQSFLGKELGEGVGKFLGSGNYKLNADTGKWEAFDPVPGSGSQTPGIEDTVTTGEGIFAGLNPDEFPGSNPEEMAYAMLMDPAKLEAKSRERLGILQAASSQNLGRMQTGSAERLGRLSAQTEKDITRSQQATDLLSRKMGYGTEYNLAKMNRLAGLQQANIQQATSLYNLIPSAF